MTSKESLPVAVIGAGPVGLAAAANLLERGLEPLVFEAGPAVGATIRQWGHVRVFSTWKYNLDPASVRLLERHGWEAPRPTALPYGAQIVSEYLEPWPRRRSSRTGSGPGPGLWRSPGRAWTRAAARAGTVPRSSCA